MLGIALCWCVFNFIAKFYVLLWKMPTLRPLCALHIHFPSIVILGPSIYPSILTVPRSRARGLPFSSSFFLFMCIIDASISSLRLIWCKCACAYNPNSMCFDSFFFWKEKKIYIFYRVSVHLHSEESTETEKCVGLIVCNVL